MFESIGDIFDDFDYRKWLRLVIIVGGYILIRNLAQRELAKRKLANQIKEDKRLKSEQNMEKYLEDPEEEEKASAAASGFGWGKKTRVRVNKQQKAFEKAVDKLQQQQKQQQGISGGFDDDSDIQDLLED
ncbi:hypothetical protein Kpol_505p35 [Vanderwaltozyma polyspora DSM 70294]|uniref:Processing of GAS1 and ALP protein 2 n=1 Tax=Vanderwaltozyma polyspora (strain ATCC 22028 / DSM 70294 / BCRC 21397 / CBS 2163 / NBRC 10782 / NRRL Y-8283 / UCD 57-17) TaxID=436907 RepID=A7TNC6_VANPO|nr:uncharacterized protein Kpol_505p35 [Vanderwaltozyma polyspora DSM 70294]EDO16258.1 hypothetical protein Kpol_505p35 [Vanderwaltozyma polyspora DSM 70294]